VSCSRGRTGRCRRAISGTFSQPLTKSGALHFTIAVVSTVGFGEHHPQPRTRAAGGLPGDLSATSSCLASSWKLIVGVAKSARAQRTGARGYRRNRDDVPAPPHAAADPRVPTA
jgi:hypothetical protein